MSDMPPIPLDHVLRTPLPWQSSDVALTECGKRAVDVASARTFAEVKAKFTAQGEQRASLTTCMTCAGRSGYRKLHDWEQSPSGALKRAIEREPYPNGTLSQLDRELLALAALAAEHPDEFAATVAGLESIPSLAARRAKKPRA